MNQLFNPVNYFEFQGFLPRGPLPSYSAVRLLLLDRAWKQKSRRGIPAPGGFL